MKEFSYEVGDVVYLRCLVGLEDCEDYAQITEARMAYHVSIATPGESYYAESYRLTVHTARGKELIYMSRERLDAELICESDYVPPDGVPF